MERKKVVIIRTDHIESQPHMTRELGRKIRCFGEYQSLQYEGEGATSHVGALVACTHAGERHLIGINTGKGVTIFY